VPKITLLRFYAEPFLLRVYKTAQLLKGIIVLSAIFVFIKTKDAFLDS